MVYMNKQGNGENGGYCKVTSNKLPLFWP